MMCGSVGGVILCHVVALVHSVSGGTSHKSFCERKKMPQLIEAYSGERGTQLRANGHCVVALRAMRG